MEMKEHPMWLDGMQDVQSKSEPLSLDRVQEEILSGAEILMDVEKVTVKQELGNWEYEDSCSETYTTSELCTEDQLEKIEVKVELPDALDDVPESTVFEEENMKSSLCDRGGADPNFLKPPSGTRNLKIEGNEEQKSNPILRSQQYKKHKKCRCTICGKEVKKDSLAKHSKIHDGERFSCSLCDKSYAGVYDLNEHIKSHELVTNICSICGKSFSNRRVLRQHMQTHNQTRYNCSLCEKSFALKDTLSRHLKYHEGVNCAICDKTVSTKRVLRRHLKLHEGARYKCPLCDESYSQKSTLDEHYRSHGSVRHKCPKCVKSYLTMNSFKQHLRTHDGKRYTCMICMKSLATKRILKKHMLIHQGKQ